MTITQAPDVRTAPVTVFEAIGSTNDEALRLARDGQTGPLWLRTARQTQGRGRQGRSWASPIGNLSTSLLLPLTAEPRRLPQLAHVAAVALIDAIQVVAGPVPHLHIKWPNDILVDRAKVAGILVETTTIPDRSRFCVIGWGVNCAHHPEGLDYATTDLTAVTGTSVEPVALFEALLEAMAVRLAAWDEGLGFAAICEAWLSHALPLGTTLTVRQGQTRVTGTFQGLDPEGRLRLLGPDRPLIIESGDIVLGNGSASERG